MREHKSPLCIYYGSIYNRMNGCIVENPAIVIDAESDMLMGWGDKDACKDTYDRIVTGYRQIGLPIECFQLIEFNTWNTTREQQCYVMLRAIEYTASGFCKALAEHIQTGDILPWLDAEMQRLPIELYGEP